MIGLRWAPVGFSAAKGVQYCTNIQFVILSSDHVEAIIVSNYSHSYFRSPEVQVLNHKITILGQV